ncbi:alpha-N-methyltransferase NTM1 [Xylariales sp. PMI_506]|nr:alpha-N-methyltransferase NTM1 [Xylariales sp. PMI_506]
MESEDSPGTSSPPPDSLINHQESIQYWESVDADVNGMLGGFPAVSKVDLRGSRAFLAKLGIGKTKGLRRANRALEGGAGIGRITQGLLIDVADSVDIIEPVAKFTKALEGQPGVGRIFNVGLEGWRHEEGEAATGAYDVIWNQWCVGHLNDQQLTEYLERCKEALARDEQGKVTGVIVVKENLTRLGRDLFDELDSAVTRCDETFRAIFARAGLKIIRTELQNGFPKELFPVRMYALRP